MQCIFTRKKLLLGMIFFIFNTPALELNIGVSTVHVYLLFSFVVLLYTLTFEKVSNNNFALPVIGLMIFCFFVFILLGRDEVLVDFANQSIPSKWGELYSKTDYKDFYRSVKIAVFQLINFILMLSLFNFSYKNRTEFDSKIVSVLSLTLFIQCGTVFAQSFFLSEDRPTGTLGNSQSVSFLLSIIACYVLTHQRGLLKFSFLCVIAFCAVITETRSVIGILLVLLISDFEFVKKIGPRFIAFLVFSLSIFLTVIISSSTLVREVVLYFISIITSPLSMHTRFLMWGSFFDVISESSVFGMYGIPPYFTDNMYWHFILPYGIFGCVFLLVFFGAMIRFSSKNRILYYFTIVYSIQAISYSGPFLSNLGMGMMLLVGYELSKVRRVR